MVGMRNESWKPIGSMFRNPKKPRVARVENVALGRIPGPLIIARLDGASRTAMVLAIDTVRSTFR
jgi:hypothetical protein